MGVVDQHWHLAQFNVARAVGPTDGPEMAEFMTNLDRINALAESSPGFVWRFQTDDGNATSVRAFDDPDLLLNLSVWETVDDLKEFTYRTEHTDFLRRRREWFAPVEGLPVLVMWWVRAGTVPTIEESKQRLERLGADGPTEAAFTFRTPFDPPATAPA